MPGLDPLSRATFARAIDQRCAEFRGMFGRETVERFKSKDCS